MFNVNHLLHLYGLYVIGLFIFAEVAMFLGFFLPGDTLLIAAGILAMHGKLSLVSVLIVAVIAAIVGDSTSYLIGRKLGPKVFVKDDSIFFRKDHIIKSEHFYEKYGNKTILIAHFLPVIRTFSPFLAGVGKVRYHRFLLLDAIGDTAWAFLIVLSGYYVASKIPGIDHYILIVLAGIVAISLVPTAYHVFKHWRLKQARTKNI